MKRDAITIKMCGLGSADAMAAALEAGADMVGLVFHPRSPRFVHDQQAAALASQARGRSLIVALVVNHDDAALSRIMAVAAPDMIQCHGSETPERVAQIRALTGRPVIRALGISRAADLAAVPEAAAAADMLLLDAKPPAGAAYPGGHGQPFDWSILTGLDREQPFMLSGGLNPDNVGEAITRIRAAGQRLAGVDVSSGIESAPGIKDIGKIRDFARAARAAAGAIA
ncbi:MAG: phosphoribosylanthranilate isomerase [Beijerinckiaceae bacterium]|jgi:phosphoribosylanthranilate isomerase|nr:phosphoribosylanthranilate isomerase [Beijerinckiaceae bacterium]